MPGRSACPTVACPQAMIISAGRRRVAGRARVVTTGRGRRPARRRLGRTCPDVAVRSASGPCAAARGERRKAAERCMTTITRTALDDGIPGRDRRPGESASGRRRRGTRPSTARWFPRSRDLAVELPELIAELDRRGVRVERFTYALDAWLPVPRKLVVQGRIVRTGGFRSMDPRRGLPDLGRRHAPRGPARRPAGDRRADRRPGAAAVHPPRAAALAADGAGRRPVDAAAAGARAAGRRAV